MINVGKGQRIDVEDMNRNTPTSQAVGKFTAKVLNESTRDKINKAKESAEEAEQEKSQFNKILESGAEAKSNVEKQEERNNERNSGGGGFKILILLKVCL